MRVSSLKASQVHGYLPIEINFFEDLTFLTGLNGSGKTSALRILMALLTPNIPELGLITFSDAEVVISDEGRDVVVKAIKNPEGIRITTTKTEGTLDISSSELELVMEARRR
ncbi:MAG TPA: ATP-binding protein, partial [Spongiibacteraceae bacterium]|nr:ATP-binding protein [Spongiibacteraceae bacterium]